MSAYREFMKLREVIIELCYAIVHELGIVRLLGWLEEKLSVASNDESNK